MKLLSEVALCDPVDCSPPGSSVHGIFRARRVDWVDISFSRRSSPPRDGTSVSRITDSCLRDKVSERDKESGWLGGIAILNKVVKKVLTENIIF